MPCDFPPWETVYHHFGRWSLDGAWERVHHTIRERPRATLGRAARPGAAIADSRSAKTTGVGGEARGYDRAKLPSRKEAPHLGGHRGFRPRGQDPQRRRSRPRRHHQVAARRIRAPWPPTPLSPVARRRLPRTGQGVGRKRTRLERRGRAQASEACPREDLAKIWAEEWAKGGKKVDRQRLMPQRGFRVLPRRWVVGRTFAWLCHDRRMSKDYERLCATGEAFVYVAMTRLMVRRSARAWEFSNSLWKEGSQKFGGHYSCYGYYLTKTRNREGKRA